MSEIKNFLDQITKLREDIRKLGPQRRKEPLGLKKLKEVQTLYEHIVLYVVQYSSKLEKSEISVEDSKSIQTYYIKITDIYNKIIAYYSEKQEEIMASNNGFDLKTAVSLLPVMNGSETVTNQLIDAVELYSTMIKDADAPLLINFVLKTRLSQSAKLRLSSTYNDIKQLIEDMKTHLLTTKSAVALQKQLLMAKQGHKSIEHYGQEIEDLFVNLTISQSNGNTDTYSVLKPINEKVAINRFSQGLRNDKLNTIISARAYSSLKDAIQGAKDEEITMTSSSSPEQILYTRAKGYNRYNGEKPFRGTFNKNVGRSPRYTYNKTNFINKKPFQQNRPRGSCNQNSKQYRQGRSYNNNKNNYKRHQVNTAIKNTSDENLQFFREWKLHSDL